MSAFTVDKHERVATILFDMPGGSVNKLTTAVGKELLAILDTLRDDATVDAAVLQSGKADVFIAGADIDGFVALESADAARRLSEDGQQFVEGIARFPKPLVAAIHGACLGGGLEVALAADFRITTDAPATKLGLPEVQLGLIPGASGCQRLPRLVGLRAALDLILTGRSVRPSSARRMGLVHDTVPPSILARVARDTAARLATGWTPPRRRRGALGFLLDANPLGRWLVFRQARQAVLKKTGGHYPAPLAALDVVRHGLARGMTRGLAREADAFGRLAVGLESRNLVRLFFATTALKKDDGTDATTADLPPVERLGVVGAGFMGSSIAGVAALRAGVDVRLRDTDWPRIATGLASARRLLDDAKARRRLDRHEHYRRRALISGAPDLSGFGGRDLVIEAVFEDLEVKRAVIAELEGVVSAGCVLASNTSTIPIADLQRGAHHPERIIGMHFFSPVDRMPLLEVIRGQETADAVTASATRFGRRMGKTVIVVRDSPGFWVNRILAPYLNEAGWLLNEGATIEDIDEAMTTFGFPVGPIALLDEVGLDVAQKASVVLADAFGARMAPAPAVAALVAAGRLGRKSGSGFYRYAKDKRQGVDAAALSLMERSGPVGHRSPKEIARRPIVAMLNESARALSEHVVRSARDADIGAVFGFGFPPFLGGPLRYIDDLGAETLVDELTRFAERHGPRFDPAPVLVAMARDGGTFYDEGSGSAPRTHP